MIDAIGGLSATLAAAPGGGEAAAASGNDMIDQQQFLQLFVSQLQNQDPLNPLDVNGLTNQLAQFSSLEQLFNINGHLTSLGDSLGSSAADPLGFLGTEVSVAGDQVTVEDGHATPVVLNVPDGTTEVSVIIRSSGGSVLKNLELGAVPPGALELSLDGEDGLTGTLPDGSYGVEAIAQDAGGNVRQVDTLIRGEVTGVDLSTQPPVLMLGSRRVPLADVREIHRTDAGVGGG